MICCVIANNDWMYGVDFHDGYPALIFVPKIPWAPHVVFAKVRCGPWTMAKGKEDVTVKSPGGNVISKIFDIGSWIPHLTLPAANHPVWMGIYTLLSASQGHFGVASVQTARGPIAVALMFNVNPQLDCGTCPTPTGFVEARTTVIAGLTIGDLLAGLISMGATWLITVGINKVLQVGFDKIAASIIDHLPPQLMLPAAFLAALAEPPVLAAGGWFFGSPMGSSASTGLEIPFTGVEIAPLEATPYDGINHWVEGVLGTDGPLIECGSNAAGAWIDSTVGPSEYFDHAVLPPPFPWNDPPPAGL